MTREVMEYDVVIVGGGPSGLATAIKLKQLNADVIKIDMTFIRNIESRTYSKMSEHKERNNNTFVYYIKREQ